MEFKLDNGLKVILRENHSAPVVAFQAWVGAGSADETEAEAGLAHVHEHMLFKGTERRGVGEIAATVEGAGGDINAWTSFDETVYHLVMSSRHFGVGIDILADALRNSAFDAEELSREREVILEEMRRSYDMPSRRASRETFDLSYSAHPYRRPVIGYEASVKGFSRDDVVAFYHKHYRPEQVVMILVGDLEAAAARKELERCFGDWRGVGEAPKVSRAVEPVQSGLRVRQVTDAIQEAYLDLAWHIPEAVHPEVAVLDLLSVMLGQGESSRLVRRLVRETQVATDAGAYAYTPRDPGLLFARSGSAPDQAEAVLTESLKVCLSFGDRVPSGAELQKAKTIILSESVYQRETVQGQARRLGFFHTVCGSTKFEQTYRERIAAVSAKDVQRAAQTLFRLDGLSVVSLQPEGGSLDEARIRELCEEASHGPRLAPRKQLVPAKAGWSETTLSSGATLLIQEDHAVPMMAVRGVYLGGVRHESSAQAGIEALCARLLTSGTQHRDVDTLAEQIDAWAASLNGSSGRNSFGLAGEFLARDQERGLQLFGECLFESAFPEKEFENERKLQLEEIRSRIDNPAGVAFDLFNAALYPTHPYGRDLRGTPESLAELSSGDLRQRLLSHYRPERLTLSVVGDVDGEEVAAQLEAMLDKVELPDALAAIPKLELDARPTEPRRTGRSLDKAQAHIVLGYPGVTLTEPRRFPLEILSSVLSGQGGRLFMELRDKRSLAYSVTSLGVEGVDPGFFGVYIGCGPDKVAEAVVAIREELGRVCAAPPSDEEIERAKRYLMGSHDIGLQRASSRAALAAYDACYGLGYDAYLAYPSQIEAVSAEDILQVAQEILQPASEVLSIVGPEGCDAGVEGPTLP